MDKMNIESAVYSVDFEGNNSAIQATLDGIQISVPIDPANRHYIEIMRQVEAGELVIEPYVPLPVTAEQVRSGRDQKLKQSDWMTIRQAETGEAMAQEWLDYRQALRDITNQDGFPENVVWPTEPTTSWAPEA